MQGPCFLTFGSHLCLICFRCLFHIYKGRRVRSYFKDFRLSGYTMRFRSHWHNGGVVINASCLPASKSPHVWLDRFTFDLDKPAQRSRATKNIYILGILYTLKAYLKKRKKNLQIKRFSVTLRVLGREEHEVFDKCLCMLERGTAGSQRAPSQT